MAVLDQQNSFGGVAFGSSPAQVPGLLARAGGVGKRWRTTRLYVKKGDTTTLGGAAVAPIYWFRANRFIGATITLPTPDAHAAAYAFLQKAYGPAQADPQDADTRFWLGKNTYMLLEPLSPKGRAWELHIASLGMLNEQVVETAVRAQARQQLGWKPDSLGLVRQFKR